MNFVCKLCLLVFAAFSVNSETFAAFSGGNLQAEQLLSTQFSSLYLEYQSLNQWFQTIQGWSMMSVFDIQKKSPFGLEEERDDDFSLEEDKKPSRSMEMYPFMGMGGYGYGGYGAVPNAPQQQTTPTRRQFEESSEISMLVYLKYLHLITARKLESAQLVHYQSRLAISMLQGYTSTNPMASSILYMLYIRDILQTLSLSQAIQRHDIWTVWNILEVMETTEFPDKSQVPHKLNLSIKKSYATSMRVFSAEAMLDFQTIMMDFYIYPMLSQSSINMTSTSYLEEGVSTETESKPFFGLGGGNYFQYYLMMLRFYAKYTLMMAAQSLAGESAMDLMHFQHQQVDSNVVSHLPSIRYNGIMQLQQWCQIKLYLVYWDMYMLMYAPQLPQQSTDGPAHVNSNLIQTEQKAPQQQQVPVTQFEQQIPAAQQQEMQQQLQQFQQFFQQFQIPVSRPSVVG